MMTKKSKSQRAVPGPATLSPTIQPLVSRLTKPHRSQEFHSRQAINEIERWADDSLYVLDLAQSRLLRDGLGMLAEHVRTGAIAFASPLNELERIETLRFLLEDPRRQVVLIRQEADDA
jgi:hypothetical protein